MMIYILTPWPAVPHFTAYPFTPQYRTLPHLRLPAVPHFGTYFVLFRVKHVVHVVNVLTIFLYHWNQKSLLYTLGWKTFEYRSE